MSDNEGLRIENERLKAENEKLRDLVRDLWARRDSLLDFGFYAYAAEQLDRLGIIDLEAR